MMRFGILCLAMALVSLPVEAQSINGSGCNAERGGTIKGVARDNATGRGVQGQTIELADIRCASSTASDGSFVFEHVPPGEHSIRARGIFTYRHGPTVKVNVRAGRVSQAGFRLYESNDVLDCLESPRCAAVLQPDTKLIAGLTEAERLREAGLRTAFAVTETSDYVNGMTPCIVDASAAVITAVAARVPGTVPGSECEMSSDRLAADSHLIHKPSGTMARSYHQGRIKVIDEENFISDVGYYMNPLGAATWECAFKKEHGVWMPKSCRMTVIS